MRYLRPFETARRVYDSLRRVPGHMRSVMGRRDKLYYFSGKEMRLLEVRKFRLKFFGLLLFSVFVSLSAITTVNHLLSDVLSLGYDKAGKLEGENSVLRENLSALNRKVKSLQDAIDHISQRDSQLRTAVNLPSIDRDTRNVGTGGSVYRADVGLGPTDVGRLLDEIMNSVQKIERETKLENESYGEIAKKYKTNQTYFQHLPAIKPTQGSYNGYGFGMRFHPVLHVMRMHEGIDIITDVGTPVVATGDGIVEFAGHSPGGLGIVVEIDHGYGLRTIYGHLSTVLVHQAMKVKRGQLIAKTGQSGLVSGPHLHYEVVKNGVKQNPVDYFFDEVRFAGARPEVGG